MVHLRHLSQCHNEPQWKQSRELKTWIGVLAHFYLAQGILAKLCKLSESFPHDIMR